LAGLAAGDKAHQFELRQWRIRPKVHVHLVALPCDGKNDSVVSEIGLRLNIDHGIDSQGIYKINVSPGNVISLSLKQQRTVVHFHVARQGWTSQSSLDIEIDSSAADVGQLILNGDVAVS